MWSPQATVYYSAPVVVTAIGVYFLYRATQLEGSTSDRAFVFGMVLVFAAWGFTGARSSGKRTALAIDLEDKNQALCKQVRGLERQLKTLRQEVHSKLAAEVFLAAMERADEHRGKSWVHFHHAE